MQNYNLTYNSKIILDYIKDNKITKREFCKKCNISLYILNKLLCGNVNKIKIRVLYRLCLLLNVKSNDIIKFTKWGVVNLKKEGT